MKKILAFTLIAVLCLTLAVSCKKADGDTFTGIYTHGESTYVFFDGQAVVYSDTEAKCVAADTLEVKKEDLTAGRCAASDVSLGYLVIETVAGVKTVTGLTDEGKKQTVIVLPAIVGDIKLGAFEGSSVKAVVIAEGAKLNLSNGCFKNGGSLAVIISEGVAPADLTCGKSMLDGTSGVSFYIGKAAFSTYEGHYNWGVFKDNLKAI